MPPRFYRQETIIAGFTVEAESLRSTCPIVVLRCRRPLTYLQVLRGLAGPAGSPGSVGISR
jgi:hypothetical protein